MSAILSVKNLTVSIPAQRRTIIDDISFDVNAGEVLVLSGANGCGKSTIIRTIVKDRGLDGLRIRGTISFENHADILSFTYDQLQENLRKRIGYVSQKDEYESKGKKVSVADCLRDSAAEFATPYKLTKDDIAKMLLTYAPNREEIGKPQYEGKSNVRTLSGGQQRLLTIISKVVVREKARLFIIDEPLNNLDTDNMINVSNLINMIHRNNPSAAFLIVTHCRIFPFITRRIEIGNGKIINIHTNTKKDCYDCVGIAGDDGFYKI